MHFVSVRPRCRQPAVRQPWRTSDTTWAPDEPLPLVGQVQPVVTEHEEHVPVEQAGLAQIHQRALHLARHPLHEQRIHLLEPVDPLLVAKPAQDVGCVKLVAHEEAEIFLRVDGRQRHEDRPDAALAQQRHHAPERIRKDVRQRVGQMLGLRVVRNGLPVEVAVVAAKLDDRRVGRHAAGQVLFHQRQPLRRGVAKARAVDDVDVELPLRHGHGRLLRVGMAAALPVPDDALGQ